MQAQESIPFYTVESFLAMPKEAQWNYELIDGIVLMSPSPSREHQTIGAKILTRLGTQLATTSCEPTYELDIIANGCVFKPDLLVFCDTQAELPELVFEILSPSTRHRDLRMKLIKYEEIGIQEYWIVDPKSKTITVHTFRTNQTEIYIIGEIAQSMLHAEIQIPVAEIFP